MSICTKCRHAEWKRTETGRLHPAGEGRCIYPIPEPQPLPVAFYYHFGSAPKPSGGWISRKDRHIKRDSCPCFEENT